MKYFIYITAILILGVSCQKSTEALFSEESVRAYNKQVITQPLVKTDGFYFISREDSTLSFSKVSTGGTFSNILKLTQYLPTGYTNDSLINLKTAKTSDNGAVLAFSYKGATAVKYTLVKLSSANAFEWTVTDSLSGNSLQSKLQTVCETTDGNIMVVSSSSGTTAGGGVGGQQPSSGVSINESVYAKASGVRVSTSSKQLTGQTIISILPSDSVGYIVFSTSQSTSTPGGNGGIGGGGINSSSTVTRYLPTETQTSPSFSINLSEVYSLVENGNQIVLSGNSGESVSGYSPVVLSVNLTSGLVWRDSLTRTDKFYFAGISKTTDGYLLSGAKYDGTSFDWSSSSVLGSSKMYVVKINESGKLVWEKSYLSDASIGLGVLENTDGSLRWLVSRKTFSALDNVVLIKTSSTGIVQ